MPVAREEFIQEEHVRGFVRFLADAIAGDIDVNHKYVDRNLDRLRNQDPNRTFTKLCDAYNEYYWPNPGDLFADNLLILDPLKARLRDARASGNEDALVKAIDRILWWGAGNKSANLYTKNMEWLRRQIDGGYSAITILNKVEAAFDADPFDHQVFQRSPYRSNAGFTKIYALMKDDFVIYDSRVAAAFGLLVVLYCDAQTPKIKLVPKTLKFGRSSATGEDNRNAGQGGYRFPVCGNKYPRVHALSNWRANVILSTAINLLDAEKRRPDWLSDDDAVRHVEAALFMLGKHIPPN